MSRSFRQPGANEQTCLFSQEIPVFEGLAPPLEGIEWTVILLVDHRELVKSLEVTRSDLLARLEENGVAYEERQLPVGDYMWIARKEGEDDRILDCVIERKAYSDLVQSVLKKSRDKETKWHYPLCRMYMQKKLLRNSGMSRKVILVEGKATPSFDRGNNELLKGKKRLRGDILAKAKLSGRFVAELRKGFHEGIELQRTKSTDDTIAFLVQQHKRMQEEVPVPYFRTLKEVQDSIKSALECPRFRYSLILRKIDGISEMKTAAILGLYASQGEMQEAIMSGVAKETLANLRPGKNKFGVAAALSVIEHFPAECNKLYKQNPKLFRRMGWRLTTTPPVPVTPSTPKSVSGSDQQSKASSSSRRKKVGSSRKRLDFDALSPATKKHRVLKSSENPRPEPSIPSGATVIIID